MASDGSRRQSRVDPDRLQLQNTSETTKTAHALPTPGTNPPAQHPFPHILDDGITELWCPSDPAQIVADIYFVHDLMGHPFKTWCHSKAAPSQYQRADTGSRRHVLSKILGRKHEAPQQTTLMEALDFTNRCSREQQLSDLDTPEKTFTWIWDTPFKTWLEHDSSIFWIYEKPASGKSTLLNYIRNAGIPARY
ncbi:hypothetical protein Z517_03962 [Fonsecaea pedrosoi CBS 271.37]|uniref:Nephrocystin 3-like N-terminal domain-containing protein n=1 Tax=Fonsecaea pedrosoi CBS 271.37 TaxID=1442368 RepID=A0A0D2H8L8_9EURO|nr:uncharacterized protein Z517_03962 [Fonsecaea pedrosoi CBS 271.37]KIW80939.1 hypothetical protein Z517_03962 [Fonsecaea pedrosoi CBS 271.37]